MKNLAFLPLPSLVSQASPTTGSQEGAVADTFPCLLGSRYIYDLYYEKEAISKQLYDWLLKNGYADANLIAKWKKTGYEKVCRYLLALSVLLPSSLLFSLSSL